MTEQGKAQIQALGAGLLGFVVVVGGGALLMLGHGGGSAIKAPKSSYAPVDAAPLSSPAPSVSVARPAAPPVSAMTASPAPVVPEEARAQVPAPAAAAAPAPAAAPADSTSFARKLVVSGHLEAESSASSSAQAAAAPAAPAPAKAPAKQAAARKFVAPKLDLSKNQGTIASTVHYGVSNRAELMGNAAGPVYNFGGRKLADPKALAGDMKAQIQGARTQIGSSEMSDADKAKMNATLDRAGDAADQAAQTK